MFGNVASSWATPQQNQQQQQQQTSAFGQPASGFGTSAFGNTGTSAFGQPAQQPQANPMFGNLGAPAANTNTGFGAFGGTNTSQNNATNPMFGGAKPSTGFGAFGGGTSAFGGGAFGQTNTASSSGTGAFGQPTTTTTTSAFGTGNSIFGASKPTTTAFGTATGSTTTPPVTAGSSNPPYAVHTEKDPSSANITLQYQSISCMPVYANTSVEEIRLQDYNQGRKTASTFGPGTFGTTQPAAGTGLFGAQPAQPTSAFGAPATNTGGFGAFGTNNTTTTPATTGAFGGGGAFGQPQQQQQQSSGFGAFGSTTQQPQQQQTGGGLFGAGGGGAGGAFGTTTSKPFGAFGSGTGTTTNAFGGGGTFGQNQQPQTQPTGGLFGSTNNTTSNTGAFGSFGNNNANNKSVFGQTTTTQPATGFGAFGSTQPQQNPQQPQTNPLFGGGGGTGIFGQQQQPQQQQGTQQPASNPLFGGGQTSNAGGLFGGGGGVFGANQQQQQTQQPAQTGAFGAFGTKPAQPTGGLFGGGGTFGQPTSTNTTQQTNSLFGSSLGGQQNTQTTAGGGLFGKPAPTLGASTSTSGGGLFGSTNQTGGLFNTSITAPGAQGTLMASISEPIGSELPIFNLLPPGPRLFDLDTSQKKKPGFFVDAPTRSPMPRIGYTPANSKLRGFGASLSSPVPSPSPLAGSLLLNSSRTNGLSLSRAADNSSGIDTFLGRSSSPALGSGTKQSVKKVILDKKVEPTEVFVKSGGSPGGLRGGKVVFSPALSAASREKDAQAALKPINVTQSPTPRPKNTPNRFTAQSLVSAEDGQGRELEEGEYYVKPDLATLKQKGYDELSSFSNLVVGRVGYGEIEFLDPVDLTGLPKLGALLGEVIRFDEKECSVYPESDDVDKPPPGSGLNVAARLSLLGCWAVDKATREPIKDELHPSASKHLKRLKKISHTRFENFDIKDGKWTFKVDHF
ncbi:Nucleoporin [Termitomyces sp. T112]|nr:Nucleoporin [Termitomyces sp. T112]KAH0587931.1 hypothetical protein H2248_006683 [Termitomyces sp. 'cryptogamus']KNZ76057.1 Nucleoporin [Termitomyces sp. J132]